MQRFGHQEDEDIQDILKRAVRIQETHAYGHDLLQQAATELGISPEALTQARMEHEAEVAEHRDRAEFDTYRRSRFFWDQFSTFVLVNLFLIGINVWTMRDGDRSFWAIYPLLFWGLFGILPAALSSFSKGPNYERDYARWKRKRDERLAQGKDPDGDDEDDKD